MYLDFNKLKEFANQLHEAHEADTAPDRYVYTIELKPATGDVRVHVEWPMFKSLIGESNAPLEISSVRDAHALHLLSRCEGVTLVAVVTSFDLKRELEQLGVENIDCSSDTDLMELFNLWQHAADWRLGQ